MKRLIKNQNIKFDTHQAGDGQAVNQKALHLEKILHQPQGIKIKFHFFNAIPLEKQNSTINEALLSRIKQEVSQALKKDAKKQEKLGELIINTLSRYNTQGILENYAIEAAQNIASYFNLNNDFVSKAVKYGKDQSIIEVTTTHEDKETHKRHKIKQTKNDITISSRRSK